MTTDLQAIIEATTDAFTLNPGSAAAQVATDGELAGAYEVELRVGDRTITSDLVGPLGGSDAGPTPGEYVLAALASCQAITYRLWSEKLGVRIDRLHIDVTGDIDLRGLFGVDGGARPGFAGVDITVEITGPETPERYEDLRRAVDEHCPVLDVFANPVPVRTAIAAA